MPVQCAGETNVGVKRNHNEDSFSIVADENLYIVADGMGGHASGEVASQLAVSVMRDFFKRTGEDPEATWPYKMDRSRNYEANRLITGIKLANLQIFEKAQSEPRYKGMGTTVAAMLFVREGAYISHVGDSRIYRIRDDRIEQLTEDHSFLNDYLKMRPLSKEEIENFSHKNVITRALGMKETVQVDINFEVPRPDDVYVLCSDGLSGMLSDENVLALFRRYAHDLNLACSRMIEEANAAGGVDNVTVIVLRYQGAA
ncbi:MAG: Stp1/IreP family PP2C-type Ser/Thr phosphatase [Myxococcota bacterium]|nr:Stp1/IreP family PP2C-type Ser/Thr phosphatase [Myxococcota bacterium]